MALFLPQRWLRQPTWPYRIDWSSPFAASLGFCVVPVGAQFVDLVSGALFDSTASPLGTVGLNGGYATVPFVTGPKLANDTALRLSVIPKIATVQNDEPITLLHLGGVLKTSAAVNPLIAVCDPFVGGGGLYLDIDDNFATGPGKLRARGITTNTTYSPANVLPNPVRGRVNFVGVSVGANSLQFLYRGTGSTPVAGLISTSTASNRRVSVGEGNGTDVVTAMALGYSRVMPIDEYAELYQNPWQIFAPLPSRLYFLAPTGGGGTTHDVTSSETASGADTPAATATFAATVAESGNAVETPQAVATLPATIAETGSAADTPAAIATLVAAVAETSSSAETTDASVTSSSTGVIEESASAADAPAAIATFAATAEEAGSAADTPAAVQTTAATVAESASAAETTDGDVVPAGQSACAEAASAVESCGAVIITAGSIAEGTASATDVAAAAAIWATAVMAETASLADVTNATLGIVPVYDSPAPTHTLTDSTTRIGNSPVSADTRRIGTSPTGHTPRRIG